MNAPSELSSAIAGLTRALESTGAPHMIIGGIAVIAHGVPRHTDDVDATIRAEGLDLDQLFAALAREHIIPRIPDAEEFARTRQVLLLRHDPANVDIEVSLAWLPFEIEALSRAKKVDLGDTTALVALPEDLLIYKAVAFRERDRGDIQRLLELHSDDIDLTRVKAVVRQFAEALEEPERATEFDELVQRVLKR